MSLIVGCLLGYFVIISLMEIAVNWRVRATQFDD